MKKLSSTSRMIPFCRAVDDDLDCLVLVAVDNIRCCRVVVVVVVAAAVVAARKEPVDDGMTNAWQT